MLMMNPSEQSLFALHIETPESSTRLPDWVGQVMVMKVAQAGHFLKSLTPVQDRGFNLAKGPAILVLKNESLSPKSVGLRIGPGKVVIDIT